MLYRELNAMDNTMGSAIDSTNGNIFFSFINVWSILLCFLLFEMLRWINLTIPFLSSAVRFHAEQKNTTQP